MDELKLIIKVKHIHSENTYLRPSTKTKKCKNGKTIKINYLYKSDIVRKYQNSIVNYITKHYSDYLIDNKEFFNSKKYQHSFTYHLNSNIDSRDLTNMTKNIEDAIVKSINKIINDKNYQFDDKYIYKSNLEKIEVNGDDEIIEFLLTKLN